MLHSAIYINKEKYDREEQLNLQEETTVYNTFVQVIHRMFSDEDIAPLLEENSS
jgi:hypothetical protein